VGAKSMARLHQNYVHWLNYISGPILYVPDRSGFMFYSSWKGEKLKVLNNMTLKNSA
jgi:hypothetical protein